MQTNLLYLAVYCFSFWGASLAAQISAPPACPLTQPQLPLRTQGRFIVDGQGHRIKLASVAWYGAESKDFAVGGLQRQSLQSIAHRIRCLGFNTVRLPWSNEMVETDPLVPEYALKANPALFGVHALDLYDRVIHALAAEGLLIVLDNHNSDAMWCCSNDGNDLWYTARYPEAQWLADWKLMAARYRDVPQVIGADLRNEPRVRATWGGDRSTDWHAAAKRGGNVVLSVSPHLLIIVEGINYSLDLKGVAALPVRLSVAHRLVYSPHDYPFDHKHLARSSDLAAELETAWGFILADGKQYTAPLWVGEFGNWNNKSSSIIDSQPGDSGGLWFASLRAYLAERDIDWSWWGLNGTESTGLTRTYDYEEGFGVLNRFWSAPSLAREDPSTALSVLGALQTIMQPRLGPHVDAVLPPLVVLSLPLPGTSVPGGSALTLRAEANLRGGSPDKITAVEFYRNGILIARCTSPPYTATVQGLEPGTAHLAAVAVTAVGSAARSEDVSIEVLSSARIP
jgi:endoglucanase